MLRPISLKAITACTFVSIYNNRAFFDSDEIDLLSDDETSSDVKNA